MPSGYIITINGSYHRVLVNKRKDVVSTKWHVIVEISNAFAKRMRLLIPANVPTTRGSRVSLPLAQSPSSAPLSRSFVFLLLFYFFFFFVGISLDSLRIEKLIEKFN